MPIPMPTHHFLCVIQQILTDDYLEQKSTVRLLLKHECALLIFFKS